MSILAGGLPKHCYTDPAYGLEGMAARRARELFKANLKELMDEAGIENSNQLAKSLGVGRHVTYSWVERDGFPEIEKLDLLADHFKVPVSRFFMDLSSPRSAGIEIDIVASIVERAIRSLKAADEADS